MVKNSEFDGPVETFQIVATLHQPTSIEHGAYYTHASYFGWSFFFENQDTEWNEPEKTRIHLRVNIALAQH